MKALILIFCIYGLSACSAHVAPSSAIKPIRNINNLQHLNIAIDTPFIERPQLDKFSICHGNTCAKFAYISLSSPQWQNIEVLFQPEATSAKQERGQIKLAIALFETYSGEQAGTDKDKAKNDLSGGIHGQLDCIDEATNTTVYLRLLANAGLLKRHRQASRTSRGGLLSPHNTATIIDTESSTRYAVDSWFYENGVAPEILPLSKWKSGWKPEND